MSCNWLNAAELAGGHAEVKIPTDDLRELIQRLRDAEDAMSQDDEEQSAYFDKYTTPAGGNS